MKTDLKKLMLNQETLMNLTECPSTAKGGPQATFTLCAPNCLETNCRCCHGKF
jgi:hypothetical protein